MDDANTVMGHVDYARQRQMDARLGNQYMMNSCHVIVGCGGVGFWLALFLAMQGQRNMMTLIDGDKLEPTNLNRIPCPPSWVGINKAIALRRVIKNLRPGIEIRSVPCHVTDDTITFLEKGVQEVTHNTIVWDCTDDARVQVKIFKLCKKHSWQYRKIGYEGFKVGTYTEYSVWFDEKTYQPGYRTTMANAMSSAMAAAVGVFAQGLNAEQDVNIDIVQMLSPEPPVAVAAPSEFVEIVEDIMEQTRAAIADRI